MKTAFKITGKEIKDFVANRTDQLPAYMRHNQLLPNRPGSNYTWYADPKSPAQVAQWITDIHKLIKETAARVQIEADKIIIQYSGPTTGKATIKRDIITDRYLVPFIAQ